MSEGGRRVATVAALGAGYLVLAVVIDAVVRRIVPVLVLPQSFVPLARGALVLTFVILLAATWMHGRPEG